MNETTRTVLLGAALVVVALVLVIRRGQDQPSAQPPLARPPVYDEMGMGPGGTHATAPLAAVVPAAGVSGGPSSGTTALSGAVSRSGVNVLNRPGQVRTPRPWGPANPAPPRGWPAGVLLK